MTTLIYTVGHSTRDWTEFLNLLASASITVLVDVRRYPGSRRHPQFGKDNFAPALAQQHIRYVHEEPLGGRRRPSKASQNTFWTHEMFRGYADHMASAEFQAGVTRVLELAARDAVAVMCAEAHPSRCHRRLLADAFVLRGAQVVHLLDAKRRQPHVPPSVMQPVKGVPTYPKEAAAQGELF